MIIKCQMCTTTITVPTDGMARNYDWRIFDGISLTGAELSIRLCPICAGIRSPARDDYPDWARW